MTFTKEFHGYEYQMKVGAEELGCFYVGFVEWDEREGFTTPLRLLDMLASGNLEEDGIEITDHDGSSIGFRIRGYEEGFTEIGGRFRQFIIDVSKDKTLAEGLRHAGVVDELTAQLIEEKAKLLLPPLVGAGASAGHGVSDNSDVIAALEALGYKKGEIKAGMEAAHLSPGMSLEETVEAVLKNMGT